MLLDHGWTVTDTLIEETRAHAGEILGILNKLAPDVKKDYQYNGKEFKEVAMG
jgi:hypothetical protein